MDIMDFFYNSGRLAILLEINVVFCNIFLTLNNVSVETSPRVSFTNFGNKTVEHNAQIKMLITLIESIVLGQFHTPNHCSLT